MSTVTGAGVYILLLALGAQLLNDPDSYSHLAVGRWIIAHKAVPVSDAFSFSMPGEHWISFEWLSQVVYSLAFSIGGWTGVVALAAAAIALAVSLVMRALLDHLSPKTAFVAVCLTFVLLGPHLLARPHALVLPVMVAWAVALVRCMDRNLPPPYWALPLLLLWANLHGSVILGLGLIGPVVLEEVLQKEVRGWPSVARRWLPFVILAVAVSCATPYGPGSLLIPLNTLGAGDALNYIGEWRPQDFSRLSPFEFLLLAGIFALSRGWKVPPVRMLLVIVLLHLALKHVRHADLLAVLAPLYLAAPLARRIGGTEGSGSAMPAWAAAASIVLVMGATALAGSRDLRPAPRNTPEAALAGAGLAASDRILNDYAFGGYLIEAGVPTFIDGRSELFGGAFITRYNRALLLADVGDFLKLLADYRIDATLLEPQTPAVTLLDRLPEWKRVYADDIAVVHKRSGAAKP